MFPAAIREWGRGRGTLTAVKICGITNVQDAGAAVAYGADALGFVFADSPRRIDPAGAGAITGELPALVRRVGVFVNEPLESLQDAIAVAGLDAVQLHGDETPDYVATVRAWGVKVVKALRVREGAALPNLSGFGADACLLDAYSAEQAGGTGRTFNWNVAARVRDEVSIILAGGLHPDNVERALEAVRPFAVDVSSGVEAYPGKKDLDRVRRFIREVRRFDVRTLAG